MFKRIVLLIILLSISLSAMAFEYQWIADKSVTGSESYTILDPLKVTLLDEEKVVSNSSAALVLQRRYNVYLDEYWTDAEAYILLNAFNQLVSRSSRFESEYNKSFWIKTAIHLSDDIVIVDKDVTDVLITQDALIDSATHIAEIEGIKGKSFSKRIHKAVLRYVYHIEGRGILESILYDRFDIEVRFNRIDYAELTENTTAETADRFEDFKDNELIYLINILEEYPDGMLKTHGLKYIIRRKDGLTHPLYPIAPAIAWTDQGYIEFMSDAFKNTNRSYIYRLILHEKSHFLWSYLFDEQLKQDWIELGGWFKNPDDPNGWSTTDETRFVSDYAHNVNPNEDMAESISFYIMNPNKLRTHASRKYEFIQNRIMHGTRYISKVREDLTFRVYNLYPDYTYPARVKRIYVKITGEPEEDKHIFVEIEVNSEDGLDNAKTAYIRMNNKDQWHDLSWFQSFNNGRILRYEGIMSKYQASGYWYCNYLNIYDISGNVRYTEPPNIGWKFYLDNPLQDLEPPHYLGDCEISISDIEDTSFGNKYNIKVSWKVDDNNYDKGLSIRARLDDPNPSKYYIENVNGNYDITSKTAEVIIPVYDYNTAGEWSLSEISMTDIADNITTIYTDQLNKSIRIDTKTPDNTSPILNVDNILVESYPVNTEYPDGETHVKITLNILDNLSGLYSIYFTLRDPVGKSHNYIFYNRTNNNSNQYISNILLPIGSIPGIWGITDIVIEDRAKNKSEYNFVTLIRFELDENISAAPSFIETKLLQNYPNPFNPETWIPYQLSENSYVKIDIFNSKGVTIRTLNLGNQDAGKYISTQKAAYWDGKNEVGEAVASGVYFYTLTTDKSVYTRKLIVIK